MSVITSLTYVKTTELIIKMGAMCLEHTKYRHDTDEVAPVSQCQSIKTYGCRRRFRHYRRMKQMSLIHAPAAFTHRAD